MPDKNLLPPDIDRHANAALTISLFGSFQVFLDGAEASNFVYKKAQALLAYLVVEPGRPHSRAELAGLLWPEYPEAGARAYLRRILAKVRQAIGDHHASPPYLHITRDSIRFNQASDYYVDVAVLNALQRPVQLDAASLHRLEQTLPQIQGPFLAGFSLPDSPPFEEWLLFKREFFGQQLAAALRALATHYEDRTIYGQALVYARRLVTLDSWNEEAHQQIMRSLARDGRRRQALAQFESCREILASDLNIEPSDETIALAEQIRTGDFAKRVETRHPPPHTPQLPHPISTLVGRKTELAQLVRLLADPDQRLVTIVGPGGIGKTHLALKAATEAKQHFSDRAALISLAPLQTVDALVPTMAEALGFSFYENAPPEQQILDYLSGKEMLLVLDNCEHLPDGVDFMQRILEIAPRVKILATSRAALHIAGEQLYPLQGLAYPDKELLNKSARTVNGASYDAVVLFLQSVDRLRPDLVRALSHDDMAAIARICCLLRGMPLGILLAATWIEVLTPHEIAHELARDFHFLQLDIHGLPERHKSLAAVFEHSWQLLSGREQEIFLGFSVFRGGCTRAAAETIARATLPDLLALTSKFMLSQIPVDQAMKSRYAVHELLRQFAANKLGQTPDAEYAARQRHSAYYTTFLAQRAEELKGSRQLDALAELEREGENLRVAWQWAVDQQHLVYLDQALEGMALFYEWRGRYQEGEAACLAAAEQLKGLMTGESLRLRCRLLRWQASFNRALGRLALARELVQRSQHLLDSLPLAELDTRAETAAIHVELSLQTVNQVEARRHLESALALSRSIDDRWGAARCLYLLGNKLSNRGGTDVAGQKLLAGSLNLYESLGDRRNSFLVRTEIAFFAMLRGRHAKGEPLLRQSLAMFREDLGHFITNRFGLLPHGFIFCGKFKEALAIAEEYVIHQQHLGNRPLLAPAHSSLSRVVTYLGRYARALEHAQIALQIWEETGDSLDLSYGLWHIGDILLAQRDHVGAEQTLQQSVALHRRAQDRGRLRDVLTSLGFAAYALGDLPLVQACLCEALQMSVEDRLWFTAIRSLPLAALLAVALEQPEQAVELYALAMCTPHIANSPWYEEVAGRHVQAATKQLPAHVITAVQARGRGRELWPTVDEILATRFTGLLTAS